MAGLPKPGVALGPSGPGAGPLSRPAPAMGSGAPVKKDPEDQPSGSLGELAVAFLSSGSDPQAAASLLLEFLTQAGFRRSK